MSLESNGIQWEVEFVSNLFLENGHKVIQCNIRDITERKRSEDALRKSEEQLRLATEGAGVGIWELVLATNALTWTARCREIFGLPKDGGMNARSGLPWDFIHPEDAGGVRASMERVARKNTPFTHEHRIITPSGGTRWVQSCGKPYYDAEGNLSIGQMPPSAASTPFGVFRQIGVEYFPLGIAQVGKIRSKVTPEKTGRGTFVLRPACECLDGFEELV